MALVANLGHPILLFHNSPVGSGIVEKPEDYLYSSAKDYHATKKCGFLDLEFL